jgi:hypothetical protein
MDRINSFGAVVVGGIRQWVNKNLAAGVPGTQTDATYETDLQEELIHGFIEKSYVGGVLQVPTAGVQNQVKLATDFFYGFKIQGISANHAVTVADRGTIFQCDAGCSFVSLPSALDFDAGFVVGFEGNFNTTQCNFPTALNNGGALQGVSEFSFGVGDFFLLQAQGENWGLLSASSGLINPQGKTIFAVPGAFNWTVPNALWAVDVTMTGAGANGAGCSSTTLSGNYSGGGGGAGATAKFTMKVVPGTVMSGTIGAPGATGGATVFAGVTAAGGAAAGAYAGGSTTGGAGGVVTGAAAGLIGNQLDLQGGFGDDGMDGNAIAYCGNGGDSFWGGGGRSGVGAGANAGAYGAGGGGARNSATGTGGQGDVGIVMIEY